MQALVEVAMKIRIRKKQLEGGFYKAVSEEWRDQFR